MIILADIAKCFDLADKVNFGRIEYLVKFI